jgi:hypothetical protein
MAQEDVSIPFKEYIPTTPGESWQEEDEVMMHRI